jgi:hypothetical protein
MQGWYRLPADDVNFKSALKEVSIFNLKMALMVLEKEQREGEKHKTRITAIKREIERR